MLSKVEVTALETSGTSVVGGLEGADLQLSQKLASFLCCIPELARLASWEALLIDYK